MWWPTRRRTCFGEGAFDVVISQFGVMFFDQPATAFANLWRSLVPGGRIAFTCWQAMAANEWISVIAEVVAQHATVPTLGGLAGGPGMFAFKDPDEIAVLVGQVGFTRVETESLSPTVLIGGGGTLDESVEFLLGLGIARGLLSNVDPDERPRPQGDHRRARRTVRIRSGRPVGGPRMACHGNQIGSATERPHRLLSSWLAAPATRRGF